jgi:hypothetical protein
MEKMKLSFKGVKKSAMASFWLFVLLATGGCASEQYGFVVDTEHYFNLSGFSVQSPTGSEWDQVAKSDEMPNSILFRTIGRMPRDFSNHADFNFTTAFAFGLPINGRVPLLSEQQTEEALRKLFTKYSEKAELIIGKATFDKSLAASCMRFEGIPKNQDLMTQSGVVRTESVIGYFCLHPSYDDFLVIMESRNGATVEIGPVNRRHQLVHFFKSLRFTPRNGPFRGPAGKPPSEVGGKV